MINAPDVLQAGAATYGPEEMSVITAAFDEAWIEILTYFDGTLSARSTMRTKLADAILQAARSNGRDVARLKASGLIALQDSPTAH